MADNKKDSPIVASPSVKTSEANPLFTFLKKLDTFIWYKKKTWQKKVVSVFATVIGLLIINCMFGLNAGSFLLNVIYFSISIPLNILLARWMLNTNWQGGYPGIQSNRRKHNWRTSTAYSGVPGNKFHSYRNRY